MAWSERAVPSAEGTFPTMEIGTGMILGFWEFLFKYPPVVFEKGRLIFASPLPWWMLTIAVALAAFAAWADLPGSTDPEPPTA